MPNRGKRVVLIGEQLSPRLCLSAGLFQEFSIACCFVDGSVGIDAADVDSDGDLDVITGSRRGPVWYENAYGEGTFKNQKQISFDDRLLSAILAADLNGDGAPDVITASQHHEYIVWYRNAGAGHFDDERLAVSVDHGASSILAADLDGDADLDIVTHSQATRVATWYENMDGKGAFGEGRLLGEGRRTNAVHVADIDGDGDEDIVAVSTSDRIHWYQNTGGGMFRDASEIATALDTPNSIEAVDMDGDQDIDIILGSYQGLVWHENLGDGGSFGYRHIVSSAGVTSIDAGDLNGDGDMDLISGWETDPGSRVTWHQNMGGGERFTKRLLSDGSIRGINAVLAADLDRDGDLDVLSSAQYSSPDLLHHQLTLFENLTGEGPLQNGPIRVINDLAIEVVSASDVDGDSDADVLVQSANKISWYENADGTVRFDDQHVIDHPSVRLLGATVVDLDNDGDPDIVAGTYQDDRIIWYENTDGAGDYQVRFVPTPAHRWRRVWVADLNTDGFSDLISLEWSTIDGRAAVSMMWHPNVGGQTFGEQVLISAETNQIYDITDFDRDGDIDILANSRSGELVWYENVDGTGTFLNPEVIIAERITSALSADIDEDGDLDIVATWRRAEYDRPVVWYENLDGTERFGPPQLINAGPYFPRVSAMHDIDGDGDLDALLFVYVPSQDPGQGSNYLFWVEHLDGPTRFSREKTIASQSYSAGVADFDNNQSLDVVAITHRGERLSWFSQRLLGDSNNDGTFNADDLVHVLAAGKYNDGIPDNATFEEGDWNQDGDFDEQDIVSAFIAGHYEPTDMSASRAQAAAIQAVIDDERIVW